MVTDAIFGFLHLESRVQASAAELRTVGARLGWRPIETAVAGPLALAVCRDAEDGEQSAQLARSGDGALWVALDGEFDNRPELRDLLAGQGPPPASDAEIALDLFARGGHGALARLQGLFALLVWQPTEQRLLLLADHSGGVRSLYYWRDPARLVFATQAKAVLAHPAVPRALDVEALPQLLTFGFPIAPRTLFRGIAVLPAGSALECRRGRLQLHRTWRRPLAPRAVDAPRAREAYLVKLRAAVERCATTELAVAVLLSGGVDSAAIVALLRDRRSRPVRTYSMHFATDGNESAEARRSAEIYDTHHTAITGLGPECLEALPQIVWHAEWPVQDTHPTYWLGQRLKQDGIRMVLSGHGNDLLWGAAPPAAYALGWRQWGRMGSAAARRVLAFRRRTDGDVLRRLLCHPGDFDGSILRDAKRFLPEARHPINAFIGLDDALFGDQMVYRELGKLLIDAHGLELRLPFHDSELTALVDALPPSEKLQPLPGGGWISKRLFREVMREGSILSEEVLARRKNWIRSPTAQWLRGDLGHTVERLITGPAFRGREIVRAAEVEQLLREHRAAERDWTFCLMTLAALEIWCRLFIDPAVIAPPSITLGELAG